MELEDFDVLLESLRSDLAVRDTLNQTRRGGGQIGYLLYKKENIKFKMDASPNHKRPHFHIDYGYQIHALSISIDSSEVLAGYLPNRYINIVQSWTEKNKEVLLRIWEALHTSKDPADFVKELKD